MNKRELENHYTELLTKYPFGKIEITQALENLKQLDEPQKPIVPQVVMDYYEFYRGKLTAFEEWFAKFEVECDGDFQQMDEVGKWLYDVDFETQTQRELALAMLIVNGSDAVEVEKEKRYTVKVKAFLGQYLGRYYINNEKLTPQFTRTQYTGKDELPTFTRKELEQADFGWVFDCLGIEIEEVEG